MAITEKLRLVFEADASGAVREIDKLASVSERQLNRAKTSTDKWAAGLVRGGSVAIGAGAVIGAALIKTAEEAGKAQAAVAALETALKSNAATAGSSAEPYRKLASALQRKTQFDDESILSGETVLVQMGATRDQITKLTPLFLDYAQRTGKDVPAAARDFGKALNGSTTALRRAGIFVDETAFKHDRFKAIMDAASQAVGGQAEAYGKTFPGQLAILKNSLNEIAEGIGAGVIPAVQGLIAPIANASNAFQRLSPEMQATIGRIGVFSSIGLVGGGGLAVLAGKVIELREQLKNLSETAPRAAMSLRVLGSVGAIAIGLNVGFDLLNASMEALTRNSEDARNALSGFKEAKTAADAVKEFNKATETSKRSMQGLSWQDSIPPIAVWDSLQNGKKSLDNLTGSSKDAEATFRKFANESPTQAQKIIDGLNAQGTSTSKYRSILDDVIASKKRASEISQRDASITQAGTDALNQQSSALQENAQSQLANLDAKLQLLNSDYALRGSIRSAGQEIEALTAAEAANSAGRGANAETARQFTDAQYQLEGSLLRVAAAAQADALKKNENASATDQAKAANDAMYNALMLLANSGSPAAQEAIQGVINKLNLVPPNTPATITVAVVETAYSQAVRARIDNWLASHNPNTATLEEQRLLFQNVPQKAGGGMSLGGLTLVGERGAELVDLPRGAMVTPNDRIGNYMQSGSHVVNYSVTVNAGIGTDGAAVGAEIVRYIKEYERRNGKRWN